MDIIDLDVSLPNYTRRHLFEIWMTQTGKDLSVKAQHVKDFILKKLASENCSDDDITMTNITNKICKLCSELAKRWHLSKRTKQYFLKKNSAWLEVNLQLPVNKKSESTPSSVAIASCSKGRPAMSFTESSERTKRRKTQSLRSRAEPRELAYAAQMSLRAAGASDAAKLIYEAIDSSPDRPSRIRKAWLNRNKGICTPYSENEALSLFIECRLTKHQYQTIRMGAKIKNANIYPSYKRLRAAKELCYPNKDDITITESTAEVSLQALLDHTSQRLVIAQKEAFEDDVLNTLNEFILISKWGCDGSTGHSEYKQKLTETTSDVDMFVTSLVPLQLYSVISDSTKKIVWHNPRPSSVRYCRPIRVLYRKETTDLARDEAKYIEEQIRRLRKSEVTIGDKQIFILHKLQFTMIDGKICNAVTSTSSSQKCYVCGATPTQMNNIDAVVQREVDTTTYQFGLSTLHAWIRFMEWILHVSYRLDFKKWQARTSEQRNFVKEKKFEIQKKFREDLGLIVDKVRPGGSGTSNDGNTARRFFHNPQVAAKITGINEMVISRSANILLALSSGYKINSAAFDAYAMDTAKLFIEEYPWYYMPASVHKILIHGSKIVDNAILPIGQLSEEAQESRNKDLKLYRRSHSRKTSRENTLADIFNLLLVSSDPVISGQQKLPKKGRQSIPHEVLQLLLPPEHEKTVFLEEVTYSSPETTSAESDLESE